MSCHSSSSSEESTDEERLRFFEKGVERPRRQRRGRRSAPSSGSDSDSDPPRSPEDVAFFRWDPTPADKRRIEKREAARAKLTDVQRAELDCIAGEKDEWRIQQDKKRAEREDDKRFRRRVRKMNEDTAERLREENRQAAWAAQQAARAAEWKARFVGAPPSP